MSQSDIERKILSDNKSGSSEILNAVLKFNLQHLKKNSPAPGLLEFLLKFNQTAIEKFSAMAMVANGLRRANQIIIESIPDKKSKAFVSDKLKRLVKEIARIDKRVTKNSSVLFTNKKGGIIIATYSNSGLVKKVVRFYRKKIKKIYLSEGRPAYEGRAMAQYFAGLGIEIVLSVDLLLPSLIARTELLLLGADSVGKDRFINKIGSGELLKNARKFGVPSAVVFESLKIKSININTKLKDDYNYREILPQGGDKNISVINPYFEIINNRRVDRFISDLGVDTPRSLKKRIMSKNLA